MTYDAIHRLARKRLRARCQRCRSTSRLQAALNPTAPVENLRTCPIRNCEFSIEVTDYVTLCLRCHVQMDRGEPAAHAAFVRARRNAPRCNECGQPMMVGQHGMHLSCAAALAAS